MGRVLLAALLLCACGEPPAPQLLRGRVLTEMFPGEPAIVRATATGADGLAARVPLAEDGGFVLALPAGDCYRLALETGSARAYPLHDGLALEVDVACAGPLHDLGGVTPLVRNCCDVLALEHQRCLADCTAAGAPIARCWELDCRDAELAVDACLPVRGMPACDRIEGARPEHPFAGGRACEAPP